MERNTDSSKLKNNTTRPKPTITTTEKEDPTLVQYGYNVDMYGELQNWSTTRTTLVCSRHLVGKMELKFNSPIVVVE